MKNTPK